MFKEFIHSAGDHPVLTGAVGIIFSMLTKIAVFVTTVGEQALESYDEWTVRIATSVGIVVSLLTVFILLNKIWRESTTVRPKFKKAQIKLIRHWRRKGLYVSDIYRKVENITRR